MEPVSRRVPGANGLSLHVLEWSADGVPMVLLHGGGNEAHLWDDFAPCVAPAPWPYYGHCHDDWYYHRHRPHAHIHYGFHF